MAYNFVTVYKYLSFHTAIPLARIICRVDCDFKSDARTEKVKGDSIKRTSAEFKKQVKNSFIVVLWQAVVQGPNCHTELVECRSMTTSVGRLFQ